MNKSLFVVLAFSFVSGLFGADRTHFVSDRDREFGNKFLKVSNRRRAIEEEMAAKRKPSTEKMKQLKAFGKNRNLRTLVNNK